MTAIGDRFDIGDTMIVWNQPLCAHCLASEARH